MICVLMGIYLVCSLLWIRRLLKENIALEHEADRLIWWVRRNEGLQPRVPLSQSEKGMILGALEADTFRALVEAPKTRAHVRNVYRGLRTKIGGAIKEYGG